MRFKIFFVTFLLCLSGKAQKENLNVSKWRPDPDQDLNIATAEYGSAKKGKVLYYLSNDENNLFVDMKITETLEQNRILKMGLTVWIDMDGKTHKDMGIKYPLGTMQSRPKGQGNFGEALNTASPLAQANTIELIGFENVETLRFPSDNADNIRGSVKYDAEGNLIYRLVIPLSRIPLRNDASGQRMMPFTIGIEYGVPPTVKGVGGPSRNPSDMVGMVHKARGASRNPIGTRSSVPPGASVGATATRTNEEPPVIIWMKNVTLADKK